MINYRPEIRKEEVFKLQSDLVSALRKIISEEEVEENNQKACKVLSRLYRKDDLKICQKHVNQYVVIFKRSKGMNMDQIVNELLWSENGLLNTYYTVV